MWFVILGPHDTDDEVVAAAAEEAEAEIEGSADIVFTLFS